MPATGSLNPPALLARSRSPRHGGSAGAITDAPKAKLPDRESRDLLALVERSKRHIGYIEPMAPAASASATLPRYTERATPLPPGMAAELSLDSLVEAQTWQTKIPAYLELGLHEEGLAAFGALSHAFCNPQLRKQTVADLDKILSSLDKVSPETAGVALIGAAQIFDHQGDWARANAEYRRGMETLRQIEDEPVRERLLQEFSLVQQRIDREAATQETVSRILGAASQETAKGAASAPRAREMLLDAVAYAELTPEQSNECLLLLGDISALEGRLRDAMICYLGVSSNDDDEESMRGQQVRVAADRISRHGAEFQPHELAELKEVSRSASESLNSILLMAATVKLEKGHALQAERIAASLMNKLGQNDFPMLCQTARLALRAFTASHTANDQVLAEIVSRAVHNVGAVEVQENKARQSRRQKAAMDAYVEKTWNLCLDVAEAPIGTDQSLPRLLALHYASGIDIDATHQTHIHEAIALSAELFQKEGFLTSAAWCNSQLAKSADENLMRDWRSHLKSASVSLARRQQSEGQVQTWVGRMRLPLQLSQWGMQDAAIEQFDQTMATLVGRVPDATLAAACRIGETIEHPSEAVKAAQRTRLYRAAHAAVMGRLDEARELLREAKEQRIHEQSDLQFLYYRASAIVAGRSGHTDLAGSLWMLATSRTPAPKRPQQREAGVREIEQLRQVFPEMSAGGLEQSVKDSADIAQVDREFSLQRAASLEAWLDASGIQRDALGGGTMTDIRAFAEIDSRVLAREQIASVADSWATESAGPMSVIPESGAGSSLEDFMF